MEWFSIAFVWFDNQPWLAFLGLFFAMYASLLGWLVLIFPGIKPDISDAHWDQKPYFWDGFIFEQVDLVASMITPDVWLVS